MLTPFSKKGLWNINPLQIRPEDTSSHWLQLNEHFYWDQWTPSLVITPVGFLCYVNIVHVSVVRRQEQADWESVDLSLRD
jgi:hypothetical protein